MSVVGSKRTFCKISMSALCQKQKLRQIAIFSTATEMFVHVEKTTQGPTINVVRDDGVKLRIRAPDRKFTPPHDLIHFVVEKGMRLQRGFWGSIAAGAKFSSVEVVDGRQKPKANERSAEIIKANERHLSEAEAIVGAFQTVLHEIHPHEDALWRRLQASGRKLEDALVNPTWTQLLSFRDEWKELAVGKAVQLEWKIAGR
jgi:hypothetical protein